MSPLVVAAHFVFAILLSSAIVAAKPCGDDVRGSDVPCACGDMVVSDLRLADDPVTRDVCSGDGLIVRSIGERSLTVDLAGHTLRGDGTGNGVWILRGESGGARVVSGGSPAVLEGFAIGVTGGGDDTVGLVENIHIVGSQRDGLRLRGVGFRVHAVEVRDAGRDGFALSGSGFHLQATRSEGSRRYGYMIMGQRAVLGAPGSTLSAEHNGSAGFSLMGSGHELLGCIAEANGKEGVMLSGAGMRVDGCVARANSGDGISGMGTDWNVARNSASANGGDGLSVEGRAVVDGGGNSGVGNGHLKSGPAVQCAVSGTPCLP